MADKLYHYPSTSDLGLYALFRKRSDGTVWNGTAMVAYVNADIGTYDVPLTYVGGDAYSLSIPDDLPTGTDYVVAVYRPTLIGTPAIADTKLPDEWEFRWNGSTALDVPPGDAAWHYANQTDVEALIGESALRIISNVGDTDTTTDTARLQTAGEWADAWMDARFATLGYVTPLEDTDAGTDLLVAEANARLTVWKLNQARVIANNMGKTPAEIAKVIEENKKMADQFFRDLTMRRITITAERLYSRASKAEAYIPDVTVCGTWCQL